MRQFAIASIAALAIIGTGHASLIGDALTIRRPYPTLGADFMPQVSTVVAAGISDAVSPQSFYYSINPEAENILIDFHNASGFIGQAGGTFDGLQFLGISGDILGVSVIEASGIQVAELSYGAGFINLNLSGSFTSSSYINLQVITADGNAPTVPEPSSLLLAGIGLGAVVLAARKRRRA